MSEKRDDLNVLAIWPVPLKDFTWVKTGPDTAVPSRFDVRIDLADPDLTIAMTITVGSGGRALVREFAVSPRDFSATVTTRMLRKIPLERLLRASLENVTRKAIARPDIHPDAFQMPGDPESQAWVSPQPGAGRGREVPKDRIARAAEVYKQALASGNRAPAEAVAEAMHYSRATAARDIRAARERGLLPPVGGPQSASQAEAKLDAPSSDDVPANPVWRRLDAPEKWMPMQDFLNRPTGPDIVHPGIPVKDDSADQ
ncbi:hypothetical protein ACIRVK_13760 [Streptomyces sp. NPDC101152]|uniref:hypothetical protein n=1 Tax=Streptomyces sp. NPDC101152 TaxID=3366116 RepID=UPI003823D5B2